MSKVKCYSVRLESLVSVSEKCYKATAFDGSTALIPKSQVFGQDNDVQKSDAYWISAWILGQKEIQYSTKKVSFFDKEQAEFIPETGVEIERHIPEEKECVEVEPIAELVKEEKITLEDYANNLIELDKTGKSRGWVEVKGINTLWLPVKTSNRTCTLNLNHTVNGFDEKGFLWGENGNCCTPYIIIEVPKEIKEEHLKQIGICVNAACGDKYPQWYNAMRADNHELVKSCISEMIETKSLDGIA